MSDLPIALLEGSRHWQHPLVQNGTLYFQPMFRLAAWDATNPETAPLPWGLPQTDHRQVGPLIFKTWRTQPEAARSLDLWGLLRRSVDRAYPADFGGWKPTDADILRGLLTGNFPCDQDIKILGPLARMIRASGMRPRRVWVDLENLPCLDECNYDNNPEFQDDYGDILTLWQRSTGKAPEAFTKAGYEAAYNSACTVMDALGLSDCELYMAGANAFRGGGSRGQHWWTVDEMQRDTPLSFIPKSCHIDPANTPAEFRRQLELAVKLKVGTVFIFGQDVTADQLSAHSEALRQLTNTGI